LFAETIQERIQDWLEKDEDPGVQLLTEEEIAADVIRDFVVEGESK
jgi:hypothetical protein